MRIFIEKEDYPIKILKEVFDDRFYIPDNKIGIINYVGYHYKNGKISFILPKIFIDEKGLVFGKYDKTELSTKGLYDTLTSQEELIWFKKFLITFYKSLVEYKNRHKFSTIVNKEVSIQLNNLYGNSEFSFLDLVLSFLNFHKKNKNIFLYIFKEKLAQKHKKVKWEKTISKTLPIITNNNQPIYYKKVIQQKYIDDEEYLLKLFYSILFHFKSEYSLDISIEEFYKIEKGKPFENLCCKATRKLKKVKYKYFSDTLLKLYKLLEIYFNQFNPIDYKHTKEEFLSVKDYHIVFEDMIDKIFSDPIPDLSTSKNISIHKLKEQKDGKLVDHLFKHTSIIDTNEKIFYIGDSKYYKPTNSIGEYSIYKQFTYAKNIIQFNIDLLNEDKSLDSNLRYRDEITEGYSISPNFFIQAIICNDLNYSKHCLDVDKTKGNNGIEKSFQFKERLFDRDTLFVHYYKINFLFVLDIYTKTNSLIIRNLRKEIKGKFRKNFVNFFNEYSDIEFYRKQFNDELELSKYVTENFKLLNGKVYRTKDNVNELIVAKYRNDNSINDIVDDCEILNLE